jgi:hypothetical protein
MRSIKRDLTFCLALSAFVFTCALIWGSPFVNAGSVLVRTQGHSDQKQYKSATITGTIVQVGDRCLLRDSSGQMYKLDNPRRAKPFEGKAVKVTGRLDLEAKLMHLESIESAEA